MKTAGLLSVTFEDKPTKPGGRDQTFGPYAVVQMTPGEMWVMDNLQPVVLATQDSDGLWTVCGLDGLTWESVLVKPHAEGTS